MKHTVKLAVLMLFASTLASASTLVVPNAQATTTGNFAIDLSNNVQNFEYQEDFGRGQFAGIGGSLLITQIAFRSAPGNGAVDVNAGSFSIFLSTSPYFPNTINGHTLITPDYAANEGADNTLVFAGGPGTFFSSPGCTLPGPCPFDMVFHLSTPFLYNPSQGTLLLDAQFTGWSGGGYLDGQGYGTPGGAVAQVNSDDVVQLGGPIVQFGYAAVPEPGSLSLLVIGFAALEGAMRRKFSA